MKRRLVTTLLCSALLGACAPTALWTKPDATNQDWLRDQFACEAATRAAWASFGSIYTQQYYSEKFYARCLQSKGYYQIKD